MTQLPFYLPTVDSDGLKDKQKTDPISFGPIYPYSEHKV